MGEIKLFLMRHATTKYNEQGLIQGDVEGDINLSANGEKEAKEIGKAFSKHSYSFDRIICSPLARCVQTLHFITSESKYSVTSNIMYDADVKERSFGQLHRRPFTEFVQLRDEFKGAVEHFSPSGGESIAQVYKRAESWFHYINAEASAVSENQNWLLLSHGGFLSCLEAVIEKKDASQVCFGRWPNICIKVLLLNSDQNELKLLNLRNELI